MKNTPLIVTLITLLSITCIVLIIKLCKKNKQKRIKIYSGVDFVPNTLYLDDLYGDKIYWFKNPKPIPQWVKTLKNTDNLVLSTKKPDKDNYLVFYPNKKYNNMVQTEYSIKTVLGQDSKGKEEIEKFFTNKKLDLKLFAKSLPDSAQSVIADSYKVIMSGGNNNMYIIFTVSGGYTDSELEHLTTYVYKE